MYVCLLQTNVQHIPCCVGGAVLTPPADIQHDASDQHHARQHQLRGHRGRGYNPQPGVAVLPAGQHPGQHDGRTHQGRV